MKKSGLVLLMLCCMMSAVWAGQVGEWTSHLAYNNVTEIVRLGDRIYALAGGAMFSVDMQDESTTYHNKQTGLHGSNIVHIAGNEQVRRMAVFYDDGLIDLLNQDGEAYAITALQLKDMNETKLANSIYMNGDYAYCSMSFGIMVLNLRKREIADVYYVGANGSAVNVLQTAVWGDSIYAVSQSSLYSAAMRDNLLDYNSWQTAKSLPSKGELGGIAVYKDKLYVLQGGEIWVRGKKQSWVRVGDEQVFTGMRPKSKMYCVAQDGVYELEDGQLKKMETNFAAEDFIPVSGGVWMAAREHGVAFYSAEGTNFYKPDGPLVNVPYNMSMAYGKLYVVPGGRWATQYGNDGCVMIYDGQQWTNISNAQILQVTGSAALDFMNVAVDPVNHEHFFVTSYGTGVYEFEGTECVRNYTATNSPLVSGANGAYASRYVRTDGAMFDDEGNLWFMNTGSNCSNLHIVSPSQLQKIRYQESAMWDTLNLFTRSKERIPIYTPLSLFTDSRDSKMKWLPQARAQAGLILLDDNGTPTYGDDDVSVIRTEFTDQDGNNIRPEGIYAVVQDRENALWVGHKGGIFTIPATVDFMQSGACERIKIPRNDGTNLADYLLNGEQVNAIAVDGSNRKWIGTETSGVYLMSADGVETIEHFTTSNSPLLSDKILSIAINPTTGVVYVGTETGLMSYQSDASDPMPDYTEAYAYPNPVREDYQGVITLTGLMEETVVHIIDAGGNLVCETQSNGGIAVWDGKNGNGKYVGTGVYTALCNTSDGQHHAVIKIMVMRR